MAKRPHITQERLKELLPYDPDTGVFTWRIYRAHNARAGDVAGSLHPTGAWHIHIGGIVYRAHRLAWLYMTGRIPKKFIDHKNRIPWDNRWCNLRLATNAENCRNRKLQSNNSTGFRGVSFNMGKIRARITHNKKEIHLGVFDSVEKAAGAYDDAAKRLRGEFYSAI